MDNDISSVGVKNIKFVPSSIVGSTLPGEGDNFTGLYDDSSDIDGEIESDDEYDDPDDENTLIDYNSETTDTSETESIDGKSRRRDRQLLLPIKIFKDELQIENDFIKED